MNIGGNGRQMMKGSRNRVREREKEQARENNGVSDREKRKEQGSGEDLSIYNIQTQQQTFRRQRQGYDKKPGERKEATVSPAIKNGS